MKRVAFVIYRKWAYEIFKNILSFQKENSNFVVSLLIMTPKAEFETEELKDFNFTNIFIAEGNDHNKISSILSENEIDVVFYYSWSWIIKEPILSKYICLCLHPSPLPKYRGGSPIQNQVINGELESAVSVFRMGKGLDDGDIYKQIPMSLSGTIDDIFSRMTSLGIIITRQFILDFVDNKVIFIPQQLLEENPPLKRRSPKQSEIFLETISFISYTELNNMVRSLLDPYPNVFISFSDGKLFIQEIKRYEKIPSKGTILNKMILTITNQNNFPLYLHLSDGYAIITKFKLNKTI